MQIDGVILTPLNQHIDPRGWLVEVWRADESEHRPAMAYVSLTKPGVIRGPHEHREQADFFIFLTGTWKVMLWPNDNERLRSFQAKEPFYVVSQEYNIDRPSSLLVPAGVVHAYQNIGDSEGLVLNLPDQLYRGEGRLGALDETRHEDGDSPFRL